MTSYQLLIEDAVTLVNALRGFIILHDPVANTIDYVAMQNFEPEISRFLDTNQMLLDLLADPEPRIIDNSIKEKYRAPGTIAFTNLMQIIIVPLKKEDAVYGLLWCDRFFKQGLFSQDDLARVIALVNQFHQMP